jgi:hypothetical protein
MEYVAGNTRKPGLRRGVLVSMVGHALAFALIGTTGRLAGRSLTIAISGAATASGPSSDIVSVEVSSWNELLQLSPDSFNPGWEENGSGTPNTKATNPAEDDANPDLVITRDAPLKSTSSSPLPSRRMPAKLFGPDATEGKSIGPSVLSGPYGSPSPLPVIGGIGLSPVPGQPGVASTSEYGRRLQFAISTHYRLTPRQTGTPQFAVVRVRMARSGRVLSLINDRLPAEAWVRGGPQIINFRIEGALLEYNRNPVPFPPGFLTGFGEVLVDIQFHYD